MADESHTGDTDEPRTSMDAALPVSTWIGVGLSFSFVAGATIFVLGIAF